MSFIHSRSPQLPLAGGFLPSFPGRHSFLSASWQLRSVASAWPQPGGWVPSSYSLSACAWSSVPPRGECLSISSALVFAADTQKTPLGLTLVACGLKLGVPQDCIHLHIFKAAAWGSGCQSAWISLLPEILLFRTQDDSRKTLNYRELLKIGCLNNCKSLRERGQGWRMRLISYMGPLLQDGEGAVYLKHGHQCRISKIEK